MIRAGTDRKAFNDIQDLFRSRMMMQILLTLSESNQTLPRLREITGSSSNALIPKLRVLENQSIIRKQDNSYSLTMLGTTLSWHVRNIVVSFGAIHRFSEFWKTHDVTGIPLQFLLEIGRLASAEIVSSGAEDPIRVYTVFQEIVMEASHIHGVSSVMSPGLANVIARRAGEGVPVELIVSADAGENLRREPYCSMIMHLSAHTDFILRVASVPVRLGLTVTDKSISLGLFMHDGRTHDSSADPISGDPDALTWGENLFSLFQGAVAAAYS